MSINEKAALSAYKGQYDIAEWELFIKIVEGYEAAKASSKAPQASSSTQQPDEYIPIETYIYDKIEDMIAEFGDDPKECLSIICEYIGLARHNNLKVAGVREREAIAQLPIDMNELELDTLRRIRELTKHGYKTIDIKVRKDGVETWFEGDFLSGTRVKP